MTSKTIGSKADQRAVLGVLEGVREAWEANDAEAFVADYLDDASVVQPGVYRKDRQEIQSSMAGAFAGPLKGSRVIDQPQDVRFLNEDTAIVISEGGIVSPDRTPCRARARSGPRECWPSATAAGVSRPTTTAPRTRDRDTRRLPWFCGKPPRSPVGCPDGVTVASGLRPKCPVLLAQP
jgi:uncharacterized protein (TIGR02246 family)